MYNHLRRCLIISLRIHEKRLMQKSSEENILLPMIDCSHIWNNITKIYKRFYCQIIINQKTDETKAMKNNKQQELDEFVSNPENKKRYQILELEVDVMRHNSKYVPEKIKPNEWLTLLKLSSKRKKRLKSFESFFSIIFLYYLQF